MTESAAPHPMPFDLWWSPSMRRFLSRHENQDDEHLVWVFHGHHEALRHYLGTGLDSNPPLPDDAVRLVLADPEQGSELERLRAQVERQHETNAGWVAYKDRKKTERFRNIEAFEDALGLERAGRGYWYERMIEAAAKVRAERDRLQASTDKARELLVACDASASWEAMYELVEKARAALPALPGDETPQPEEDQP